MSPPSPAVLQAFGVSGRPENVAGGRGLCYRVGDIVFKPSDGDEEAKWTANLATRLLARGPSAEYRLPRPLPVVWVRGPPSSYSIPRDDDDDDEREQQEYVFEGWTAATFVSGSAARAEAGKTWIPLCDAIFRVSRALNRDIAALGMPQRPPDFVARKTDRWVEADRVTWGEKALADVPRVNDDMLRRLSPALVALTGMVKPLSAGGPGTDGADLESQCMHADLTSNVLFDSDGAGLPPAVIDLTPLWRPPAFAEAIVIADCITWKGEGEALVRWWAGDNEFRMQLLIRALYWRDITFAIDSDLKWIAEHAGKVDFATGPEIISSAVNIKK
ncbi:hypothetical protein BX600DRAFT_512407 [Xylariales sp. PMI_506]|nr:hypothetical protein BX600DRAFT_512407 [Xylariales sp. PMI_506]